MSSSNDEREVPQRRNVVPSASRAVLLGVSEYPSLGLTVPAARRNLDDLVSQFLAPALWGIPRRNIDREDNPTRGDLLGAVGDAARLVDEDGVLLVYFAGHAVPAKGGLGLLTSEATATGNDHVSVGELVEIGRGGLAKERILILDCCYAGMAARDLSSELRFPTEEVSGWQLLAPSAFTPASDARVEEAHTPFTAALLKVLKDGVPAKGSWLSPGEVLIAMEKLLDAAERRYPVPTTNSVSLNVGWVKNRAWRLPKPRPLQLPDLLATANDWQLPGFESSWPKRRNPFVGREEELTWALRQLPTNGAILSVIGPRRAGKEYFVEQVLALAAERPELPTTNLRLLRLGIPNSSAPEPVLDVLATALNLRLDDLPGDVTDSSDAMQRLLVNELKLRLGASGMVMLVEGSRLGTDPAAVRRDLDRLLGMPLFERAFTIVTARADLDLSGNGHLRRLPSISLGELSETEATLLLNEMLADAGAGHDTGVVVDAQIWSEIDDGLVRLPGVLRNGVDELANQTSRGGARLVGTSSSLTDALLHRSAWTVAECLDEADCNTIWIEIEKVRRPGSIAFLCAWALMDGISLSMPLLDRIRCGLDFGVVQQLVDSRVLVQEMRDGVAWHYLGRTSRHALQTLLLSRLPAEAGQASQWYGSKFLGDPGPDLDELDAALAAGISALVPAILTLRQRPANDSDRHVVHSVKRAIGWLDETGSESLPQLRGALNTLVAAHSGDALLSPIKPDAPMATSILSVPDCNAAVAATQDFDVISGAARVNQALRATGPAESIQRALLTAADMVTEAIKGGKPETFSYRLLKSVDTAMFVGGRRFSSEISLLPARERAMDRLYECATKHGEERPDLISACVSWLLNTAELQLAAGRREDAASTLSRSVDLLGILPEPKSTQDELTRLQLNQRLLCALGRCATGIGERVAAFTEARDAVVKGLTLSEDDGERRLWSMRLCNLAALIVFEQATTAEQRSTVDDVLGALDLVWRSRERWPTETYVDVWHLLYKLYRGDVEVVRQLDGARQALALLGNVDSNGQILDTRAEAHFFVALCLHRNHQFNEGLAEAEVALDYAKRAHSSAPSAGSLLRELRILKVVATWRAAVSETSQTYSMPSPLNVAARDQAFLGRLRQVQQWLRIQTAKTRSHAILDIWCNRARWGIEGNLGAASTADGEDFSRLPLDIKLLRVRTHYRRRRNALDGHRNDYGPSVALLRLEVHLERQYRRWLGVLELYEDQAGNMVRRDVDNAPVWELLDDAISRWPGHPEVLAAKAEFYRYTWEYVDAIEAYRQLASRASDGQTRLQAALGAVEATVAYAQFAYRQSNDPDPEPLLREASTLLEAEARDGPLIEQIMLLRARVALELGATVDWSGIEEVGAEMVHGGYTHGVSAMLNRRRHGDATASTSLADPSIWRLNPKSRLASMVSERLYQQSRINHSAHVAVEELGSSLGAFLRENFTKLELLRGLGSIYLRRAELEESVTHARRAFDYFDGCRVFQEAMSRGKATPVTRFLMARAILLASKLAGSANPFTVEPPGETRTWLSYAERLFRASKDQSVGRFGKQCSFYRGQAAELLVEMSSRGSG